MPTPTSISTGALTGTLRPEYQSASEELQRAFDDSQNGFDLVRGRAALVDRMVEGCWRVQVAEADDPQGLALAAIGGFGRQELFPCSDIDLLFVCAESSIEAGHRDAVRGLCQQLWDIGLRVSSSTRTVEECERMSEENPEFTLSLLDRRYLAGDYELFHNLDRKRIPQLIERRRQPILEAIARLAEARHAKFQHTLFHLEPNVKDGPGGLRDFQTCAWLARLLSPTMPPGSGQDSAPFLDSGAGKSSLLVERRAESELAHRFLLTVRAFLHYRNHRDDNMLYWQAQDEAAQRRLGLAGTRPVETAQWMRQYFRHARSIDWLMRQMVDEIAGASKPSLIGQIRQWRKRTVLAGCPVAEGRISLKSPAEYTEPDRVFALFQQLARQPLELSREAEAQLSESLAALAERLPDGAELWSRFEKILLGPEAAHALRVMHGIGILELLLPEFHSVDALVVRDAYHRYTVDEHTFLIIQHLHALERATDGWEANFGQILREVEEPGLLYLAALLHDTGKARSEDNHAEQSLTVAAAVAGRWGMTAPRRDTILRLIRQHLEMSRAMRKDIFDAETIHAFAGLVGTPHDLRLLTLLTYADIRSVNPEALTPWKAENLWRLYIATSNHLDRNVDDDRIAANADTAAVQSVVALDPQRAADIHRFLAGLPQRYLRTRSPEEIGEHWRASMELDSSAAAVALSHAPAWWECTVVTRDRPFLFADLAGALTAWGMDIIKAEAFSNQAGTVIDTFRFVDRYCTLILNPGESQRFEKSLASVAGGTASVEQMLTARAHTEHPRNNKTHVETRLSVDNRSSTHSTILQVVAQDTPGLLRRISRAIAEQQANISVALVDTEGEMAIDVFYLTESATGGETAKLNEASRERLQQELAAALAWVAALA